MAKDTDVGDLIGNALGKIAREAAGSLSSNGDGLISRNGSDGPLSGLRGVAAGAALAAAAPFAAKGAGKVVKGAVKKRVAPSAKDAGSAASGVTQTVAEGVKGTVGKTIDKAGDAPGAAKEAGKGILPGVGGGEKGKGEKGNKGTPGVGKGRRMPVEQAVDVGVPLSTAYNQWTQFEEWPQFMHRLEQATQEDDCNVSFKTKMWGMSREFDAEIIEQRPDERIAWKVTKGVTHTGVVTFHELAERLTRVQVTLDLEPGSLLEKAARGMRHVKRAVRGDLARFKAFIEMQEVETGAWRGVIKDGEVVRRRSGSSSGKRSGSSGKRSSSSSSGRSRSSASGRNRSSSARASSSSGRSRSGSTRKRSSSRRSSSRS